MLNGANLPGWSLTFSQFGARVCLITKEKLKNFTKHTPKLKRTNCELFVCQGKGAIHGGEELSGWWDGTFPSKQLKAGSGSVVCRVLGWREAEDEETKTRKKIHFPRNYSAVISKIKLFFSISLWLRVSFAFAFWFVRAAAKNGGISFLALLLLWCLRFQVSFSATFFMGKTRKNASRKTRNGQLQGLIVYENVFGKTLPQRTAKVLKLIFCICSMHKVSNFSWPT